MKNIKRILSIVMLVAIVMTCMSFTAFASSTKYTTGKCNLRKGAALSYGVIETIPKGTKLTTTSTRKDSRGVTWYYTRYDGNNGWVSGKYLTSSTSGKTKVKAVSGDTYIRKSYSKSSKIYRTLYKGQVATYLKSSKKDGRGVTWYKVSYKGTTGWVSSRYTKLY